MIRKLIRTMSAQRQADRKAELYRNFIRHEAKIGGELFGQVESGRRREFFCLDEHTWVWHEEWRNARGEAHVQTTRYDIRPSGVIKSQNGKYQPVSPSELSRLITAMKHYQGRVYNEIYSLVR